MSTRGAVAACRPWGRADAERQVEDRIGRQRRRNRRRRERQERDRPVEAAGRQERAILSGSKVRTVSLTLPRPQHAPARAREDGDGAVLRTDCRIRCASPSSRAARRPSRQTSPRSPSIAAKPGWTRQVEASHLPPEVQAKMKPFLASASGSAARRWTDRTGEAGCPEFRAAPARAQMDGPVVAPNEQSRAPSLSKSAARTQASTNPCSPSFAR